MEKLASYLATRRKGDFARAVGISPAYLSQILSSNRSPSLRLMQRIAVETKGKVDLNSWSSNSCSQLKRGDATLPAQGSVAE